MCSSMDLELLNYINSDMKWTVMRKGRTSMTRCPRKPVPHSFQLANKIHESPTFERKKSVTDAAKKVKKSRLLHEDSGQRCRSNSLSQSQKRRTKTKLRNGKISKCTIKDVVDFSGIELLAAVACSSFIHDKAGHVEEFSISKEHTTPPGINSCTVDTKDAESNGSSTQQNVQDIRKEVEENKVAVSKGLRLHWDLNTVMDEWEEPCDDSLIEPELSVKHEAVIPLVEDFNNMIEDSEGMGTKKISIKTSDGESCASKSDVVDSLTRPGKCEDFSSSTTSVLMEQTVVKIEAERIDEPLVHSYSKVVVPKSERCPVSEEAMQGFGYNKITADHVSECCGSNVTQEELAEGDLEDKLQTGYDSPFEDGELRELNEKTDKETVYEPVKTYKDDLGSIENPLSEKVDHAQTIGDHETSLLVKKAVPKDEIKQKDTFERPHFDESRKVFCERKDRHDDELPPIGGNLLRTSFDVGRNDEYVQQNRFSASGDFSKRVWDLKSHRSLDSNYSRNYNSRGGGYRSHDRRPSPSERNNGYGSYRGPAPARSHSRERYRFHSQEYHDPKPCFLERKRRFSSSFNQHDTRSRPRSRSRSRSGSPIAWHFQKPKNLETSNEIESVSRGVHVPPERASKCYDDRRFRDAEFRDDRQTSVTIKQRFDPIRYPERLKSDNYFRRSAKFSQMSGYKYR